MKMWLVVIIGLLAWSAQSRALFEINRTEMNSTSVRKVADDGIKMREIRRVGVGMNIAGSSGLAGLQMELNFTPLAGLVAGFGTGDQYNSFGFAIKRVLGGTTFLPYGSVGLSHWYSGSGGSYTRSNPAFFAEKFLNEREKATGKFAETMIYPAVGLQYMQLQGDYAGLSVFTEIQFLLDLDDFVSAPAGSLGLTYYF